MIKILFVKIKIMVLFDKAAQEFPMVTRELIDTFTNITLWYLDENSCLRTYNLEFSNISGDVTPEIKSRVWLSFSFIFI